MPKNDIQKQGRILMLPVDCIEPSPYQARTAFDEPEIAALAVSILQNGLLQPISVRRVGIRKYQLVEGSAGCVPAGWPSWKRSPLSLPTMTTANPPRWDFSKICSAASWTRLTRRAASRRSSGCGAAPRPRLPAVWD